MKNFTFAILLIAFTNAFGQFNKIETDAVIKSVTVYTTSAEISYQRIVRLKAGKNSVVFTGLSEFIEDNTVNVSASNDINIITVSNKVNYIRQKSANDERINIMNDSILKMKKEIGLLNCKAEAFENEKKLLFKDESIGGVSKGVAVSEIEKADKFYQERYYELVLNLYNINETVENLKAKIIQLNNQINTLSTTSSVTSQEINVLAFSNIEQDVTFSFKYLTSKAGWAPFYDIRYNGPDKPIEFVFRANVFNASGIDWHEVEVKLSTADPINGFDTPTLNSSSSKKQNSGTQLKYKQEKYNNQTISYNNVQVSEFFAEYKINNKYTIPSDAKPYLIEVTSYNLPAIYNYLAIPKVATYGFLMARIPDWGKINLISGTTNVYNLGTYMGKTFLNTWSDNDTLSVYLGTDSKVQAIREEKLDHKPHSIIGNYITDETKIVLTIKNAYQLPINVTVLDQVPISDDDDHIKIEVVAENAQYNKNDGLLTWNFQVTSNGSSTASFQYILKAPKEYRDSFIESKRKYRTLSCPSF